MENIREVDLMENKYDLAMKLLGECFSYYLKKDIKNYPEIGDNGNFEYLKGTIDIDQLCKNISENME